MTFDSLCAVLRTITQFNAMGVAPDTDDVVSAGRLPRTAVTELLIEALSEEFVLLSTTGDIRTWLISETGERYLRLREEGANDALA